MIIFKAKRSFCYVKLLEKRVAVLSAGTMKEKLFSLTQNQEYQTIVFDLRNCSFCDASGLGAINAFHHFCEEKGIALYLIGIQRPILKLIKLCRLDADWRIVNSILAEDLFQLKISSMEETVAVEEEMAVCCV